MGTRGTRPFGLGRSWSGRILLLRFVLGPPMTGGEGEVPGTNQYQPGLVKTRPVLSVASVLVD